MAIDPERAQRNPSVSADDTVCFVIMRNDKPKTDRKHLLRVLKAVASPVRLDILRTLRDPEKEFPAQIDGDPMLDGICADFIREKMGIAAATASRHLTLLTDAGLLIPTRKKGWTFYRRDDQAIRRFATLIREEL